MPLAVGVVRVEDRRMETLILGGTHHVGRALVEQARSAGHRVTVVNRGRSVAPDPDTVIADRTEPGSLAAALAGRGDWDAVLDTWSGAPAVVRESARLLAGRAGHYGYVSSRSVYRWPIPVGADESAPVVDGRADDTQDADYAVAKRGGELAVLESFPEEHLLARAGLILGPYEVVGRMPWWMRRVRAGGRVLAPGTPDRGLQYIDARDLADWMLTCADTGVTGTFNTVSRPNFTTMGEILEIIRNTVGSQAEFVWADEELMARHGIQGWTDLPFWLSPDGEGAGLHEGDVEEAYATGLRPRPVADTVADTWAWLQAEGYPAPRNARAALGLDPQIEAAALADHDRAG